MKHSLGIICGGRSGEHEVSLRSASGIFRAIDRERLEPLLVGIAKDGTWHAGPAEELLDNADDPARISLKPGLPRYIPSGGGGRMVLRRDGQGPGPETLELDVLLPIIHGTDGEDGALQGMLRIFGAPFVGADVLGSAVGMDKDIMKRLLQMADLPIGRFAAFISPKKAREAFPRLAAELGLPLFVKPSSMGSSVGVSRVDDEEGYRAALEEAFRFDDKVVVEEALPGREVECSVLGNRHSETWPPRASRVGEIIPSQELYGFYSYAAKYLDDNGAQLLIPAPITPGEEQRVQELAVRVFEVLECDGLARVDFFLAQDGRVVVNEINSLPGFTPISMYPKLWEASGLSYTDLLTRLVELALERHARRAALARDFTPA
ncbi:MAG: D-alanine--D-alanine ligase [Deltaproteobacteria bacterium]|nr:D-alanine--D-alanine ligase [Deltaproteobacteria bacterium]